MSNPYGVPGISVQELAEKRSGDEPFILLDVREIQELAFANLGTGVTAVPLSELANKQQEALPPEITSNKDAEILVLCHHGNRSAQVTAWFRHHGWTNVFNVDGGIEAYALEIDATIGRY